jgi:flagellar biosynthesis/type III secretory pathway M-ring protein FliF/YscJ
MQEKKENTYVKLVSCYSRLQQGCRAIHVSIVYVLVITVVFLANYAAQPKAMIA